VCGTIVSLVVILFYLLKAFLKAPKLSTDCSVLDLRTACKVEPVAAMASAQYDQVSDF
jgi:hypothetical protein